MPNLDLKGNLKLLFVAFSGAAIAISVLSHV